LTGRSIYTTDRAHLHHHLVERMGHRMTLVCVGSVALVVSIAALASVWSKNDSIAIICAAFVVLMFVSLRVFGHSELLLAVLRLRSLLRSIFHWRPLPAAKEWNDSVHLQGTREWGLLWEMLTECAAKLDFVQLRLDLNVPVLGEGYHASWSRPTNIDVNRLWRLDLPLIADKRVLGYVKVVGERDAIGGHNVEQLLDLLKDVEQYLVRLLYGDAPVPDARVTESRLPAPIPNPGLHEPLLDQK
jgi:UDP-GlcNAc:undecaprenyl-phosphate GlcNAc-1-phosphate transferase